MLIKKESKEVWVFIGEESKQSLGLYNKLVQELHYLYIQVVYIHLDSRFYNTVIRLSLSPSGVGRSFTTEVYFLHLGRQRKVRALVALDAFQVILVQNNQYAIVRVA